MRYGIINIVITLLIKLPEVSAMKKIINVNKKTLSTILKLNSLNKPLKTKDKKSTNRSKGGLDTVITKLKLVIKEAITVSCPE
jgi:hypothetical protein